MSAVATAIVGSAVVGAVAQSDASKSAARASERASRAGIESLESGQAAAREQTQPFVDVGLSASSELASLLGIQQPSPEVLRLEGQLKDIDARISQGPPPEPKRRGGTAGSLLEGLEGLVPGEPEFDIAGLNAERAEIEAQLSAAREAAQPTGQGRLDSIEEINPVLSFLRDEGFQDIQESAAARGRLGAGGTLKDLARFNTQLGATIVPQLQQQRFNQLFNLLGLGSNAASGQATQQLGTATNVAKLQGNIGQAQAQNAASQGQISSNLVNNLAGSFGAFQGGAFNQPSANTPQPTTVDTTNPNRFQAFS